MAELGVEGRVNQDFDPLLIILPIYVVLVLSLIALAHYRRMKDVRKQKRDSLCYIDKATGEITMSGDKDQMELEKPKTGKADNTLNIPKNAPTSIGNMLDQLRLQSYKDKDEIHIHDDANKAVFVYKGKTAFAYSMDFWLRNQYQFKVGDVCVMAGDILSSHGNSAPSDLVMTRLADRWNIELKPCGTVKGSHLIGDPVLTKLDQFVQRI